MHTENSEIIVHQTTSYRGIDVVGYKQNLKEGQKLPLQDWIIQQGYQGTPTPNYGSGCSEGATLCIFTFGGAVGSAVAQWRARWDTL